MNHFDHNESSGPLGDAGRRRPADSGVDSAPALSFDSAFNSALDVALGHVFEGVQPPVGLSDRIVLAWQARAVELGASDSSSGSDFEASEHRGDVRTVDRLVVQPRSVSQRSPIQALAWAASLAALVAGATTVGYWMLGDLAGRSGSVGLVGSAGVASVGLRPADSLGSRDVGDAAGQSGAVQSGAGQSGAVQSGAGQSGTGQSGTFRSRAMSPATSPVVVSQSVGGRSVVDAQGRGSQGRGSQGRGSQGVDSRIVGSSRIAGSDGGEVRPGFRSQDAGSSGANGAKATRDRNSVIGDLVGVKDSGGTVDGLKGPPRGPWGEHEIVALVNARLTHAWHESNVTPAARASDEDWCRRLFIRVLGRIPTVVEVREFLAEASPDKREQWAQRLTASDSIYAAEFAAHWADFWVTALTGVEPTGAAPADEVAKDLRDIARPTPEEMVVGSREQLTAYLTQRFQERVSFARVAAEVIGAADSNRSGESDVNLAAVDRIVRVFLGGDSQAVPRGVAELGRGVPHELRAARVAASAEFSQAVVNRVWGHFLGCGLVDPNDEIQASDIGWQGELLTTLAARFAEHRHDVAALVRWVALSEAFGVSSRIGVEDPFESPEMSQRRLFSHYYARPMRVEQLYESLQLLASDLVDKERLEGQPSGHLVGQAMSGDYRQRRAFFMAVARRSEPASAGDASCENPQAIIEAVARSLITADAELPRRVFGADESSLIARVVGDTKLGLDEKVVHLFQAAVARHPSAVEAQAARDLVGSSPMDPAIGLRDLWWALLNSNEFLLDH